MDNSVMKYNPFAACGDVDEHTLNTVAPCPFDNVQ